MSIQEVSAEQLAELFHHYHEKLGPDFGCGSKLNTVWEQMPQHEKKPFGCCCPLSVIGIGLNSQRARKCKALLRKAG